MLVLKLAKLVIDTLIHRYALHTIYGWSLHLIEAASTSVTHLLLLLGQRSNDNKEGGKEKTRRKKTEIRWNQPLHPHLEI